MSEKIVQLNEEVIKGQLKELVRGSVEETLNELLEKEAESLTQAARYERSEARQGYRSGHYDRSLTTTSGDVTLHMPRLKGVSFETAIIERYRRRESSVEEALIEMYLAGVSVRRVEDITEALWGSKASPATISELNKKAYVHIEDWRNRPLQGGRYPYVYVDGIYLRRNWGGEYENVSVLVAIVVNEDGFREVLGAAEGMKEDKASWVSFFQWLRGRGLDGVKLIVGDKCMGMLEAVGTTPMVSRLPLVRREGFEPPAFWSVGCLKAKSESFWLQFVLFTAIRSADFPLFPSSPACFFRVLGQKWVKHGALAPTPTAPRRPSRWRRQQDRPRRPHHSCSPAEYR